MPLINLLLLLRYFQQYFITAKFKLFGCFVFDVYFFRAFLALAEFILQTKKHTFGFFGHVPSKIFNFISLIL